MSQLRLLSTKELAAELGRSAEWVYEHADQLGAIRFGDDRPRLWFSRAIVAERLAALSASPPARPATPANGSAAQRRGRTAAGAKLLDIGKRRAS